MESASTFQYRGTGYLFLQKHGTMEMYAQREVGFAHECGKCSGLNRSGVRERA